MMLVRIPVPSVSGPLFLTAKLCGKGMAKLVAQPGNNGVCYGLGRETCCALFYLQRIEGTGGTSPGHLAKVMGSSSPVIASAPHASCEPKHTALRLAFPEGSEHAGAHVCIRMCVRDSVCVSVCECMCECL